jgi:hypothetical protein
MGRAFLVMLVAAGCSAVLGFKDHQFDRSDGGIDDAPIAGADARARADADLTAPDASPPADGLAGPDASPPADGAPPDAFVATAAACLLINEVQTGGSGGPADEFVEIFNRCTADVGGFVGALVYRSATGTTNGSLYSFSGSITFPAQGFVLIGGPSYVGPPAPAVSYPTGALSDLGGGLALIDASQNVVTSMGWGTATNAFVRVAPAPAETTGDTISRVPNGADSGNDSVDFMGNQVPTPGAPN